LGKVGEILKPNPTLLYSKELLHKTPSQPNYLLTFPLPSLKLKHIHHTTPAYQKNNRLMVLQEVSTTNHLIAEETYRVSMILSSITFWQTRWQSASMCLVRSWKI